MAQRQGVTSISGKFVGDEHSGDINLAANQLLLQALTHGAVRWIRENLKEQGAVVSEVRYVSALFSDVTELSRSVSYGALSTPGTCKIDYLIEEKYVIVADLPAEVIAGFSFGLNLWRALELPFINAKFQTTIELSPS